MPLSNKTLRNLRRQANELVEHLAQPETVRQFRDSATELIKELPETVAQQLERALQGAAKTRSRKTPPPNPHEVPASVINASGCLLNDPLRGVPLLSVAVEGGLSALRSFRAESALAKRRVHRQLQKGINGTGCVLSGKQDVAVAQNVELAVMAIAQLAREDDRPIILPRQAAIRLGSGVPLPELLRASGAVVHEVGSSDSILQKDWERAAIPSGAIVIVTEQTVPKSVLALRFNTLVVQVAPVASLGSSPEQVSPPLPSVKDALASGIDLVVASGGGVNGGPECGLLIGTSQTIDNVTDHPMWSALCATIETLTMLADTLNSEPNQPIPVRQFLETPVENLQHRAERLATRLAASEESIECKITDFPATISDKHAYQLPSRQLKLRWESGTSLEGARRLAGSIPSILCRVEDESVIIDLRWVSPADDSALANCLVGGEANVDAAE